MKVTISFIEPGKIKKINEILTAKDEFENNEKKKKSEVRQLTDQRAGLFFPRQDR
jgi:hypothetical protein